MGTQYNMVLIFRLWPRLLLMGLAITLEANRGSDTRLRHGLRALPSSASARLPRMGRHVRAAGHAARPRYDPIAWHTARLPCWIFFSVLAAFGDTLARVSRTFVEPARGAIDLATIWALASLCCDGFFTIDTGLWDVADVWTRYVVAVPAACWPARADRATACFQAGGHGAVRPDACWLPLRLRCMGCLGQTFVRASPLPPLKRDQSGFSLRTFGFPIRLCARCRRGFGLGDYSLSAIV